MFFSSLDKIDYAPTGGKSKVAVNILNSILLKYTPVTNSTLYFNHIVKDGETPEMLAHKYYGTSTDHWIILLLNNIVDPWFDWALSTQEFAAYIDGKYGEGEGGKIHHLFNLNTRKQMDDMDYLTYVSNGVVIAPPLPLHIRQVTNIEYETTINDEKREIKILAPEHVQDFKNQFEDLMDREVLV